MKENPHDIQQQYTGSKTDNEASAEFHTIEEAKQFFEVIKHRLFYVNGWQSLAGTLTAGFQLTDNKGNPADREAREGDYFKIDIPGPGTITGEGYDWVQVEKIEEVNEAGCQSVLMRVRPASNPLNERSDVAHFFTGEATSNFTAKCEGKIITAGIYGRNEKPNTETETITDKARNTAVATGAITLFSKIQWKSLVNGFVKKEVK